jgi:uncharacterized protein
MMGGTTMRTLRGPRPDGLPCWLDLAVPDVARAAEFYEHVLGWTYEVGGEESGRYHTAKIDGRAAAGMGQVREGGSAPSAWTVYFAAGDIGVRSEHARGLGATLVMHPMEIPRQGHMAIAQDPTGAHFGLWQALEHTGFGAAGAPGTVAWCELRTRDPVAAQTFYTKLLGLDAWSVEGAANRYRALGRDGGAVAGILHMGVEHEGVPPHWLAYFQVDDADRAAEAVERAGGLVSDGPIDATRGRVVMATDPFGAAFAMVQPPPRG